MSAKNLAAEEFPSGAFGGPTEPPAPRGWTPEEQDQHYAALCDAIGAPNDRAATHHGSKGAA